MLLTDYTELSREKSAYVCVQYKKPITISNVKVIPDVLIFRPPDLKFSPRHVA